MQPYAQFGQQALGPLGALMGFPALPPATGRDAAGNPLGPTTAGQPPLNMSDPRVQHLAQGGSLIDPEVSGMPRPGTIGAATQSSYRSPASGTQGIPPMAAPSGGGSFTTQPSGRTARMQSPTGEFATVPVEQVGHFQSLGAKRVG